MRFIEFRKTILTVLKKRPSLLSFASWIHTQAPDTSIHWDFVVAAVVGFYIITL